MARSFDERIGEKMLNAIRTHASTTTIIVASATFPAPARARRRSIQLASVPSRNASEKPNSGIRNAPIACRGKSPRLRARVRTLSGFDPAGDGGISYTAVRLYTRVSAGHAGQLDAAPTRAGGCGKCSAGDDDGGCAGVRADCVQHLLADSFVERSGHGDSRAVPAGRSDRGDRAV